MHSNTRQERLDKKFGGTDVKVKDLPKSHPLRIKRRKRIAVWTFAFILVSALVAPLSGFLLTGMNSAVAQEQAPASNPRADMWRAVRGGTEGYSAIKGPESGVLTQSGGIEWTKFRNGPIVKYAPWAILGMFLLILLYHVSHGKNRLKYDRSGAMVKRWSSFERFVHWTTAISFIILSITGLSMLLGKKVILPMLGSVEGGKAAYAAWTQLSMQVHNFVGPILSVGIVLMIVMWTSRSYELWRKNLVLDYLHVWFGCSHFRACDGCTVLSGHTSHVAICDTAQSHARRKLLACGSRVNLDDCRDRPHLYWYSRHRGRI